MSSWVCSSTKKKKNHKDQKLGGSRVEKSILKKISEAVFFFF